MTVVWNRTHKPSVEGRAHRTAKEMVARMARGGDLIVSFEHDDRWHSYHFDTSGFKVVEECAYPSGEHIADSGAYFREHGHYPEMILDVGLVKDGRVIAGFEVVRTHGISPAKRERILTAGILCVCVKAEHWDWYIDERRIEAFELILPRSAVGLLTPVRAGVTA